ncbi:MAG: hypothetical protein QGG36_15015 [Pirellulaceae bacterium]|jgi:septal ring factor EnvC (AmiA/AmiB activator)|nr:hypothetical protein [Pirellulaceae bacterium]MDP7017115.1 hypothetical protein [Pirellulaceae bacterium]
MTLLGKIFTVLILVLSVLFMAFSVAVFATHKQWREYAAQKDKEVANKKTENELLDAEIEKAKMALAREQAARRFHLAALFAKLDQTTTTRDNLQTQLTNEQANHGKLVAMHDTLSNELARLTGEVTNLRDTLRTTQQDRDAQFDGVVRLTDEINRLNGNLRDLAERRDQLIAQAGRFKAVLDAHGLDVNSTVANIPPKVDGVVTAVGERELIEISLGSDDGIKEGHQFDVYRQNTYLGRVVIRRTEPDRAVAEIMKEYRKGSIKRGDRVATKLI